MELKQKFEKNKSVFNFASWAFIIIYIICAIFTVYYHLKGDLSNAIQALAGFLFVSLLAIIFAIAEDNQTEHIKILKKIEELENCLIFAR